MSVSIQITAKSASLLDLIHVSFRKKKEMKFKMIVKSSFCKQTAAKACTRCVPIISLVSISINIPLLLSVILTLFGLLPLKFQTSLFLFFWLRWSTIVAAGYSMQSAPMVVQCLWESLFILSWSLDNFFKTSFHRVCDNPVNGGPRFLNFWCKLLSKTLVKRAQ